MVVAVDVFLPLAVLEAPVAVSSVLVDGAAALPCPVMITIPFQTVVQFPLDDCIGRQEVVSVIRSECVRA